MCKGGCLGKCGCNMTSTTRGEKGDPSSVASLGYSVYVALLTQTGTSNPTVVVLQDTITGIVWTRNGAGDYRGTKTGAFANNKVWCSITDTFGKDSGSFFLVISRRSDNFVELDQSVAGVRTDGLDSVQIEIRVYP